MKSTRTPLYQSSKAIAVKEPGSQSAKGNRAAVKDGAATLKRLESQPSVDINESAEAFIRKFKQELLLQRLQSIENYEQMLARGT